MLGCGDFKNGFVTFICLNDGKMKKIPLSSKGRLCTKCGKRHADEWAEGINKEMFDVIHPHVVLTVSNRLWSYFEKNSELLKLFEVLFLLRAT